MVRTGLFLLLVFLLSGCSPEVQEDSGSIIRLHTHGISMGLASMACRMSELEDLEQIKDACRSSLLVERVEVKEGKDGIPEIDVWGGRWSYYAVLEDGIFVVSEHGKVLGRVGVRLWQPLPIVWFRYVRSTDWAWQSELAVKTVAFLKELSALKMYQYSFVYYKPYQGYTVVFRRPRLAVVLGERELSKRIKSLPLVIAKAFWQSRRPRRITFIDADDGSITAVIRGH